jgi:hypothetical protein
MGRALCGLPCRAALAADEDGGGGGGEEGCGRLRDGEAGTAEGSGFGWGEDTVPDGDGTYMERGIVAVFVREEEDFGVEREAAIEAAAEAMGMEERAVEVGGDG